MRGCHCNKQYCDRFGKRQNFETGNENTGNRPSCAIVTTSANTLMQPIHDRMPVILHADDYAAWLDPEQPQTTTLERLLRPCPPDDLVAFAVSTRVNNTKNNDEALILPVDEA